MRPDTPNTRPTRRVTAAVAALAACFVLAGCGLEMLKPRDAGRLPEPLSAHEFHDSEQRFLQLLGDVGSRRSDADLVRAAQAACGAVMNDGATRSDLVSPLAKWGGFDEDTAHHFLTMARVNLCGAADLKP